MEVTRRNLVFVLMSLVIIGFFIVVLNSLYSDNDSDSSYQVPVIVPKQEKKLAEVEFSDTDVLKWRPYWVVDDVWIKAEKNNLVVKNEYCRVLVEFINDNNIYKSVRELDELGLLWINKCIK